MKVIKPDFPSNLIFDFMPVYLSAMEKKGRAFYFYESFLLNCLLEFPSEVNDLN